MKGTSSGLCTIQLRGLDIKNVEPGIFGLGRSDPFFELSRKNADHAAGVVRWYVLIFFFVSEHLIETVYICLIRILRSHVNRTTSSAKGILCFVHNT